jgi:hypothetical protein
VQRNYFWWQICGVVALYNQKKASLKKNVSKRFFIAGTVAVSRVWLINALGRWRRPMRNVCGLRHRICNIVTCVREVEVQGNLSFFFKIVATGKMSKLNKIIK